MTDVVARRYDGRVTKAPPRPETVSHPETAWHAAGTMLPCVGGRVFVRTEGDVHARPPTLLLHGFPTSSYDYVRAWSRLPPPLVALDFLGFGMSDKPKDHGYGIFEHADVILEVLSALSIPAVHLVAHDMALSVAAELFARRERRLLPVELLSATLSNGGAFADMARLEPAQHLLMSPLGGALARLSSERAFRHALRRLVAEPEAIEPGELRTLWALFARADGARIAARTIGYVEERRRFAARWQGALERLELPTLVLWGAKDPVAALAVGERLATTVRGATLRVLTHLGHYPQLEGPDAFAGAVADFLRDL